MSRVAMKAANDNIHASGDSAENESVSDLHVHIPGVDDVLHGVVNHFDAALTFLGTKKIKERGLNIRNPSSATDNCVTKRQRKIKGQSTTDSQPFDLSSELVKKPIDDDGSPSVTNCGHQLEHVETIDSSFNDGSVIHKDYSFLVIYWRHGFMVPENGRVYLSNSEFLFKGIIGTKIQLKLRDMEIEKTSRIGGLVQDAFSVYGNHLNIDTLSKKGESVEKYLFTTVIKDTSKVYGKIQDAILKAKTNSESKISNTISEEKSDQPMLRAYRDETLQKMTIIAKQSLNGLSLQEYYDIAWSEGENGNAKPIYGPFLESCGKNNVKVDPWETKENQGEWCGEIYSQERNVTFNFMKQTFGQTLVEVKHIQRCRHLRNNHCVVHITVEMSGFLYSDCFVVEVRHVASKVRVNDLSIEIGMFVRFLKSCMFESKIKSNTGAETKKVQVELLDRIVEECKINAKEPISSNPNNIESNEYSGKHISSAELKYSDSKANLLMAFVATLQIIVRFLTTIFERHLKPYIRPDVSNTIQSLSFEDVLHSIQERLEILKEKSMGNDFELCKMNLDDEIKTIEKSLCNIERLTQVSRSSPQSESH